MWARAHANGETPPGQYRAKFAQWSKYNERKLFWIYFNGTEFKQYDQDYYVSADGDVYSVKKNGLLRHYIDLDGYHRVDIHGRHMKIHRLVYLVWKGAIPSGKQINHLNDDKNNNHISNLYLGDQKENIRDCINNHHRVGHVHPVKVFDKKLDQEILFSSVKDFLRYTGHPISNGALSKCLNRKWFNDRFQLIEQKGVTTTESYKSIRALHESGVENKAETHEASRVGRISSPSEAQGICGSISRDGLCG